MSWKIASSVIGKGDETKEHWTTVYTPGRKCLFLEFIVA